MSKKSDKRNKRSREEQSDGFTVTSSQFRSYFMFKAFDVIGDGNYRKFVVKSKDNSDQWAVDLLTNIQIVNSHVKHIIQDIHQLQHSGNTKIYKICHEVTTCINPPVRPKSGWNICNITGMRTDSCIDISRSGRADTFATIHSKFSDFIMQLWFVTRIEHIIKIMTKNWIETQTDTNFKKTELCRKFESEYEMIDDIFESFKAAYDHIRTSFRKYSERDSLSIEDPAKQAKKPKIEDKEAQTKKLP